MMLVQTMIQSSAIEGNGIFAAELIKKGQIIWEFVEGFDVEFTNQQIANYAPIGQDYLHRYTYPHPAKKGVRILDGDSGRFMNHADKPNTDFTFTSHGIATKDIAVGEEITCNYNEFAGEIDF